MSLKEQHKIIIKMCSLLLFKILRLTCIILKYNLKQVGQVREIGNREVMQLQFQRNTEQL